MRDYKLHKRLRAAEPHGAFYTIHVEIFRPLRGRRSPTDLFHKFHYSRSQHAPCSVIDSGHLSGGGRKLWFGKGYFKTALHIEKYAGGRGPVPVAQTHQNFARPAARRQGHIGDASGAAGDAQQGARPHNQRIGEAILGKHVQRLAVRNSKALALPFGIAPKALMAGYLPLCAVRIQ